MTPVEIHIYGASSKIEGDYPKEEVTDVTSYYVQNYQYSDAYKKGHWDGRKRLLRKGSGAFPTGLVSSVKKACEDAGYSVSLIDHRQVPVPAESGYDLEGISFDYPYDYQIDAAQKVIQQKQGIVKISTGGGKTEVACAVTQYLRLQTLFVVPNQELMYQTRKRFIKRLGLSEKEVGMVGDGKWDPGSLVTIAMLPTLESRVNKPECQKLIKNTEVLFLDECHKAASETWFTVATLCPAYYRVGLSATPLDRSDGADLRLVAATGDVIVSVPNKELVDRGIIAKAAIVWDKITEPVLKKKTRYPTAYKEGVTENDQLLEKVVQWAKMFHSQGLNTLILCEEIKHGKRIEEALWMPGQFIPHQFIYGNEDTETRQKAIESFSQGNLPVLVASTIFDEGVDIPTIDALILAGSKKSKIRTMQRIGRGLRGDKLIVVEFSNFCHKYLLEHSYQRYQDYKNEDCFELVTSGPDEGLIKELWNERLER